MAFRYRRSIDGEGISACPDYTLDATYAATAKRGDVVKLNATGNLVLAATADTSVLGVLEGFNFEGITVTTPKVGKVRLDPEAAYQADTSGAGTFVPGDTFKLDGTGAAIDLTSKNAGGIFKVYEVVNGNPYVVITARTLV